VNGSGEQYLREGKDAIARAYLQAVLGDPASAEALARQALADFSGAMNWLEDTPEFEVAHLALDEAGRWTRQTFGCWLTREGTGYFRTCPADLAHNRIGMSVGMTDVVRQCTVCGQEPRLCRHIRGRTYRAPRLLVNGYCNVCGEKECGHQDGELGEVLCIHWIVSCKLKEVSLVRRPAQPMARILKVGVPASEMAANLGPEWVQGMDVSCDRCLSACLGVHDG
jgi:hypothetical protein